jgi:RHS repeat-associated protein
MSGRFGYTGQMRLPEIGSFYHYKARAYAPAWGRFLQPDPIGTAGGMNLYAYTDNDPVNGSDPSGLAPDDIVVIGKPSPPLGTIPPSSGCVGSICSTGGGGSGAPPAPRSAPVAAGLLVAAGGLAADDVTVIGIADDPLIPVIVGAAGIAATAEIYGPQIKEAVKTVIAHGNSARSLRPTEVYTLINRSSGAIDKIGCTCNSNGRYSRAYLAAQNIRYFTVQQYRSRYPALVHENIALTWYRIQHGQLPRLNKVAR